jgi:hypothetical protein
MKLELEFTITETSDDTIEGTFNGHDEYGLTQSIAVHAISQYIHQEYEWDNEKLGVSLFEENGEEIDPESMFGKFVAWKDGVPA